MAGTTSEPDRRAPRDTAGSPGPGPGPGPGAERTDLRLVPAAGVVWAAALLAVARPAAELVVAGAACVVLAVGFAASACRAGDSRRGRAARAASVGGTRSFAPAGRAAGDARPGAAVQFGAAVRPGKAARSGAAARPGAAVRPVGAGRGQVVLVLGTVGVLLLTTAVQVGAREAGGLRALAELRASVLITGVVRTTPMPVGGPSDDGGEHRDGDGRAPPGRVRLLLAVTEVAVAARRPGGDGRPGGGTVRTRAAVEVVAPGSASGLRYGTVVTVPVRLAPARRPTDRAVARAQATADPQVRRGPPGLLVVTERLRAGLGETSAELPGDAGRLLPAVAVGDTRGVGDLEQAMRDSGLAHLTAVSGAHFSLLGAVVLAIAARLRVPRRWRWVPTAVVMAGFVALVHPAASVVRAAVMGGVGLLGLAAGRPSRTVPALACAVVVLLVVDPWLGRDLGFVLSVVATAGIAVLAAPLARRWQDAGARGGRHGPAPWWALACAVPVAAQAVCAPVVLLLSPQVPVYSVPANLLAAPAVAPATVGGLVAALLGPWWPDGAGWAAGVAGAACWWIAGVARTAAGLPGALVTWTGGPVGVLLLAAASAASVVLVLRCRRRVAP